MSAGVTIAIGAGGAIAARGGNGGTGDMSLGGGGAGGCILLKAHSASGTGNSIVSGEEGGSASAGNASLEAMAVFVSNSASI